MKILVAILMGFCSGFLIYAMAGILLPDPADRIILLFVGWAMSSYGLARNACATSNVVARGFLLGAVELLLMVIVALTYTSQTGGGMPFTVVRSIILLFLAGLCFAGFGITHLVSRQKKPEAAQTNPLPPSHSRL